MLCTALLGFSRGARTIGATRGETRGDGGVALLLLEAQLRRTRTMDVNETKTKKGYKLVALQYQ